jgi:hypothetical protein
MMTSEDNSAAAPISHRKHPERVKRIRSITGENVAKSMKASWTLPLMTVELQD